MPADRLGQHGTRLDSQRRLTRRGEHQARAAGIAIQSTWRSRSTRCCSVPRCARRRRPSSRRRVGVPSSARCCASTRRWRADSTCPQALDALPVSPPQDGRLLLVGHEPDLSLLAGGLTGGRIDLKKGGLAVVAWRAGPRARGWDAAPRRRGWRARDPDAPPRARPHRRWGDPSCLASQSTGTDVGAAAGGMPASTSAPELARALTASSDSAAKR